MLVLLSTYESRGDVEPMVGRWWDSRCGCGHSARMCGYDRACGSDRRRRSDGPLFRAEYLVGCDGGPSLIRKTAGIAFPGWYSTTSHLIAEVELAEEPEWAHAATRSGSSP
jgi:2-polyprenyl-6-methoxyphenol hydroxylase-like FAD-dependent oxidoreductase